MEIRQCFLTNNNCYKAATPMTPVGIVLQSTGANNPSLARYVQPDDGVLGGNRYGNHWNNPTPDGQEKCVHFFIGKDKNGVTRCYQTLPLNFAAWGVGSGSKGSYNYDPTGHIHIEICEDGLSDHDYFNMAFGTAENLCAELCLRYGWTVDKIVSHEEAGKRGYGSDHVDPAHWLKKFNWTMDNVRAQVQKRLIAAAQAAKPDDGETAELRRRLTLAQAETAAQKAEIERLREALRAVQAAVNRVIG